MPTWKQIKDGQLASQVANAALSFRIQQEAERSRPPADVFVSYSSRDRAKARLLCAALEDAGVAVFLDEKTIKPGDHLPVTLEAEIRKRKYYLLLLSKHSAASNWVTYEWALAKGLGCDLRMLRIDPEVVVPAPLSDIVAGDDQGQEVLYYRSRRYDRLSLQVLLRDILRPLTMRLVTTFRPVPDGTLTWEHPDISRWPDEARELLLKSQLGLVSDPAPPRVGRIGIHPGDDPPRLVLQCERERSFEIALFPTDGRIPLRSWWHLDEERVAIVHPAFWQAAVAELESLLNGETALVTRGETEVDNLFPVLWG